MKQTSITGSVLGVSVLFGACAWLMVFHDFGYSELLKNFVLGRDGVVLVSSSQEIPAAFSPWEPLERNASLDEMLAELCTRDGQVPTCYRQSGTRFRTLQRDHVIVRDDGTAYSLERNTMPVAASDITSDFVTKRLALIGQWAMSNQRADGSFPYTYDPTNDVYGNEDFIIRQLLTVQGFYAVAHATQDPNLAAAAQRAQAYILQRYLRSSALGTAYVVDYDGSAPLGDTALAILMLRAGGKNAAITPLEKKLAQHLVDMQRSDGSFQTFLASTTSTRDEKYYSGEALSALAALYAVDHHPDYAHALEKGYTYYRHKLENDFEPQYAPWHMQAYAIAYTALHDERYADYVYWLADGLIETMLNHDERAMPDEVGRFFNPEYPSWGPPHSASTSIYLEGITYAYELARSRGDLQRQKKYYDAMRTATRALLLMQWTPESAYYVRNPQKVVGSFKVNITNNLGRIDQIGHSANALVRVAQLLAE